MIRPALIWLALFFGVNGFLFGASLMRSLSVLQNRETGTGTIIERSPRNPIVASYEVEGRHYTAATGCAECVGIEAFNRLRVGDNVTVEYNRAKPQCAVLGSAKRLLASDVESIAFLTVGFVLAAAYFEYNIRKYLCKSSGRTSAQPSA
jgi:Protein of unknown function (DUF3592)